jgi:SpoVK/Ycf46/Vps4 family AAA+-type ATPase
LTAKTHGFSGADLAGLVKSAVSFALERSFDAHEYGTCISLHIYIPSIYTDICIYFLIVSCFCSGEANANGLIKAISIEISDFIKGLHEMAPDVLLNKNEGSKGRKRDYFKKLIKHLRNKIMSSLNINANKANHSIDASAISDKALISLLLAEEPEASNSSRDEQASAGAERQRQISQSIDLNPLPDSDPFQIPIGNVGGTVIF